MPERHTSSKLNAGHQRCARPAALHATLAAQWAPLHDDDEDKEGATDAMAPHLNPLPVVFGGLEILEILE